MKRILLITVLIFSLLPAGCNQGSNREPDQSDSGLSASVPAEETAPLSQEELEQKRQEIFLSNADFAGGIPLEQKLEDYEYFWQLLREGYPFVGVAQRAGVDIDAVYQSGLEFLQSSSSDLDFNSLLFRITTAEFGNLGHLQTVAGASGFRYLFDVYEPIREDNPRWDRVCRIIDNPVSKAYYDGMQHVEDQVAALQEESQKDGSDSDGPLTNAVTQILEEGNIAYLRIPSFRSEFVEADHQILLDFYQEIAEYPHLIIDLTGNGGGNDRYWRENIVSPNIEQSLTSHQYFLFNSQAQCNQEYLQLTWDREHIHSISELPALPALAAEDLALFDSFVYSDTTVEPDREAGLFQGRIWVLVDEWVYSSSETFALFCKDTDFATLVGTPTGGDGGGPEGNFFVLPNSGLVIQFSVFYSLNPDGSNNEEYGTVPDIESPEGEAPLDTCLKAIKAL